MEGCLGPVAATSSLWWTDERARLYGWFQKTAPELATVYLGGLRILMDEGFPGRVHFAAHAMREIANRLSLNPPVWWVCGGCRVREKGLLICDDCDVDIHIRLKNRRHFLCLNHRAVQTGSQRPSTMRDWWPTRA